MQSLPQVASYNYDALDRLTSDNITSAPSSSATFAYDANNNRLSDGTETYSYASASNRLTSIGGTAIAADAAGNITSDGTRSFTYSTTGQLQSVSQACRSDW